MFLFRFRFYFFNALAVSKCNTIQRTHAIFALFAELEFFAFVGAWCLVFDVAIECTKFSGSFLLDSCGRNSRLLSLGLVLILFLARFFLEKIDCFGGRRRARWRMLMGYLCIVAAS